MQKYEYVKHITKEMVEEKLPKREETFNKWDLGKLFCICSSKTMPGAASFAISAALKCGVGLIKAGVGISVYKKILNFEPSFEILSEDEQGYINEPFSEKIIQNINKSTSLLIGCGLGKTENIFSLVQNIILYSDIPIVVDADAINAICRNIDILKKAKSDIILTPNIRKMVNLVGKSCEEIENNKINYAKEFSLKYSVNIVLKGYKTIICDKKGNIFINTKENVGMAKAGSGDVLSGIIASFLAQNISSIDACICRVFIHSLAGDICRKNILVCQCCQAI